MDLSVIVPTHNRRDLLPRTLEGFCVQTGNPPDWELLVVDDGSTDATEETVKTYAHRLPIRYFHQGKSGVSTARNLGLREARGKLVLFLDDDVIPSPQLLAEHFGFHRQRSQEEFALLGYVTWNPELKITPFMRWYGEFGGLFGYSRLRDDGLADARYLYSSNISFKTGFLRAAGGFNESLTVLEDHELGFRMARRGMKLFFRRATIGFHNQTFTFNQACRRLEKYSPGLEAFLSTDAGRAMAKRRARAVFRVTETGVRIVAPLIFPLLGGTLDSDHRLPNALYRLFYWYYGIYESFWSRVSAVPETEGCSPGCN
jgi:glycosyltransferase involved in cell wall biosynthesis